MNQTQGALRDAINSGIDRAISQTAFHVFSQGLVFAIFATFLLPLWSLCFAVDGLGREREMNNLVWLLARPLPRPAVYLAKFLAILPWSLCLNLGGFALLCLLGGAPGRLALQLYWPAVLLGTLAFCAMFHLMGSWLGRPAIVAIMYSFFLETLMGNMPGYLKRVSISYYVRCMMFDASGEHNIGPPNPSLYLPVNGWVACVALAGLTVGLLLIGMLVFSRREYLN